jgi:protein-L-isoaspartate(D-aspartate) O-methyltransferase
VDIEQARFNMIEQQIRPWDVLDFKILDILKNVPREQFVPDTHTKLAFADIQIPLAHGEVMMEPKVEARLVQELNLTPDDKVLEVGTGSGYVTALLASLAKHVVSVDIHKDLSNQAADKLSKIGITNITLESGDAIKGWPSTGGFDAILLTGSVAKVPNEFIEALKDGGRFVAIVGENPVMEAISITKTGDSVERISLFDTMLPPLVGAKQQKSFVF